MVGIKNKIKKNIYNNLRLINCFNHTVLHNRYKLKKAVNLSLNINRLIKNSTIDISGRDNYVEIGNISGVSTLNVKIQGNNNYVVIEDNVLCVDTTIWVEDDNNCIIVKKGTSFTGSIQLSVIEGTTIEIGNNCLFSSDVDIRTGDSHSIMDINGKRTNLSQDITIGDNVWCGKSVSILKGGGVYSNSVVGTRSVINKQIAEKNVLIAGIPGKVVKRGITWSYDRI